MYRAFPFCSISFIISRQIVKLELFNYSDFVSSIMNFISLNLIESINNEVKPWLW